MTNVSHNFKEFCDRSGCDSSEVERIWTALKVPQAWLGGGALRRTLIRQPLDSDFDWFFYDADAMKSFVDNAKTKGLKVTKETKHHTQLEGVLEGTDLPVVVQAIHFTYGDIQHFIDSFDYTISQFMYDGVYLYTTDYSLWDLGRKKLALNKVTYPVATMRRMLKYTNQGFTACAGCMADLYKMTVESPTAMGELDIEYVD